MEYPLPYRGPPSPPPSLITLAETQGSVHTRPHPPSLRCYQTVPGPKRGETPLSRPDQREGRVLPGVSLLSLLSFVLLYQSCKGYSRVGKYGSRIVSETVYRP